LLDHYGVAGISADSLCATVVAAGRALLAPLLATYTTADAVQEGDWEPIALVLFKAIREVLGLGNSFDQLTSYFW
jgi:hypothetical protein